MTHFLLGQGTTYARHDVVTGRALRFTNEEEAVTHEKDSDFQFSIVNSQLSIIRHISAIICSMLQLSLSWDLFIVVFFAIVMSYSFIIGKHQAMKIIIASYIAIIATQGLGNVALRLVGNSEEVFTSIGIPLDMTMIALGKIFLFAVCIIIFVIRSGIEVSYEKEAGSILNMVYTGLFGFSTAGLIVSTILTYAAGSGILDTAIAAQGVIGPLAQDSTLMQLMILNQDIWYTLPAFLIIAMGFLHND